MKNCLILFFFCLTHAVFAQKDSIVSFDAKGNPTEYALFRNGFWVNKKLKYEIHNVMLDNNMKNIYLDTIKLQWIFEYPKTYKRPIASTDTLSITQKPNQKPNIFTLTQKDSTTTCWTSNAGTSIVHKISPEWTYVEEEYQADLKKSFYYQSRPDSIWTVFNKITRQKEVHTFCRQGAKKWSRATYQGDTLQTLMQIDDNIPTWYFADFYGNGQKKREISAHKDSIPTLTLWKENGKKKKAIRTWKYDMFGTELITENKNPLLLKLFPYYSGLYVKIDKVYHKNKNATEIAAEDEEWGFEEDGVFGENSPLIEEETQQKYSKASPFLTIYKLKQGLPQPKTWQIHTNGAIHTKLFDRYELGKLFDTYSLSEILRIKSKYNIVNIPKQTIPFISLDKEEYLISTVRGNSFPHTFDCYVNTIGYYNLYTIHYERYKLRALAGMGAFLPMKLRGIYRWNEIMGYYQLLKINHSIEAISLGCMGEETPQKWLETVKNIDITTENTNLREATIENCRYVNSISGIYECYAARQKQYMKAKWEDFCKNDTSLPHWISQYVRLYYKEDKLQKVVFLEAIYDKDGILSELKPLRKPKDKIYKYWEQILFEMPSYIIPQAEGKRKIMFDYRVML